MNVRTCSTPLQSGCIFRLPLEHHSYYSARDAQDGIDLDQWLKSPIRTKLSRKPIQGSPRRGACQISSACFEWIARCPLLGVKRTFSGTVRCPLLTQSGHGRPFSGVLMARSPEHAVTISVPIKVFSKRANREFRRSDSPAMVSEE